jgi:hypothetical protein
LVTDGHEFAQLNDLGRIIVRTEGLVASAEDVDAVGNLMKLFPIPVLVLDGGGDGGGLTLRGASGEKRGQLSSQQFLPGRLEDEAIAGQRSLGRTIEFLALGEEVQAEATSWIALA